MSTLSQDLIDKTAKVLQEWGNEATFEMRRLLQQRLKQNSQVSALAESIDFTGTKITSTGTTAVWNLNDYWIYVDLGVKGVQNRSRTLTSKDYPQGFRFKNLFVSQGFQKSLENYIARKGIPVANKQGQSKKDALPSMAYGMAVAIKRKGIEGTGFYSSVFNEQGFKKLTNKLEAALGQQVEIRILQDLQ